MHHRIFPLLLFAFLKLIVSSKRKLTAITDQMPFTGQLYLRLSYDAGVDVVEWLAVNEPPEIRKSVCQDIMSTDYFIARGLLPFRMDDVIPDALGSEIGALDLIYRVTDTDRFVQNYQRLPVQFPALADAATNPHYTVYSRHEDLFLCPAILTTNANNVQFFWISKEYNVSHELSFDAIAGRFIFRYSGEIMAMAEEPAIAFSSPDFNVEVEYMRRKQIYPTAPFPGDDPLCSLAHQENADNEYDRLCMKVLGSSYFEGKFTMHPRQLKVDQCSRNRVFLQTEEVTRAGFGEVYSEWMLRCEVKEIGSQRSFFYLISRAYNLYEAFVYSYDSLNGRAYLESLSAETNIVDVGAIVRTEPLEFWQSDV